MTPRAAVAALSVVVAGCIWRGPGSVDRTGGPSHLLATRTELQAIAAGLEQQGRPENGDSAQMLAEVRRRLDEGDFRLDDRVLLYVDGEAALTDTFAVSAAQEITLPGVGIVSLRGVLRSELEDRMRQEIARIVRQPVVRARALIRLGVVGAVKRPGFHHVPADGQLADLVTAAEGYITDANQRNMTIQRNDRPILAGKPLQTAVQAGRTLDQMGLRGGDQLTVPAGGGGMSSYEWVRLVALLLTIPITIYTLGTIFGRQ